MEYTTWPTFLKFSRWDYSLKSSEASSVMSMFSVIKVSSDPDSWAVEQL